MPFEQFVPRLSQLVDAHRDPVRAASMAAYMRNQFAFAGITAPKQKELIRESLMGLARPSQDELTVVSRDLWALDEREYQYAAVALLIRNVRVFDASFLSEGQERLTTKSWWDTVDALASRVVGPLIAAFPELVAEMDVWCESTNLWLRRSAILHQLTYKGHTDAPRFFGYCLALSGESDFFIRKAIGWALREYSKTDAHAVVDFVETNSGSLSPLSRREALLWLRGGRRQVGASAASQV